MSLLLANGHASAERYPISRVWEEAYFIEERLNAWLASEMIVLQAAVSSIMSREGGDHFKDLIGSLRGDDGR